MTLTTATTRAVVIDDFDDPPHVGEVAVPELAPTQVLIRVRAASINAFDWKAAVGFFRDHFTYRFPVTIGRDYSGVVEAVGAAVQRVGVGDEVFGYFTGLELHRGSYAGHVWVDETECFALKPAALDHPTAACLPLCGIVAIRCVEAVSPSPGDRVLVVGAPGGVGSYAVQLAAARGAHVIATGPAEDEDYLVDLGAAEVIRPGDSAGDLAGLIDLVHRSDTITGHLQLLAPRGRAASTHRAIADERLGTNVTSMPDRTLLERLGELAARGELRVPIQGTLPLEQAADDLTALKERHSRGKLVITMEEQR